MWGFVPLALFPALQAVGILEKLAVWTPRGGEDTLALRQLWAGSRRFSLGFAPSTGESWRACSLLSLSPFLFMPTRIFVTWTRIQPANMAL